MILLITIAFFFLVLILPHFWAFGLTFFFHSVYFQYGTTDISSFGFFVVLLRLISNRRIDIAKLIDQYNSIKLFIFILIVNIIWSISWGANASEFIISNVRMLISMITFSYFINEVKQIKSWLFIFLIPFGLMAIHYYLLANELHPLFETVKKFDRLSGRTITGEFLNANQAAYSFFALFVIFFIFKTYHKENSRFFLRWVMPLMLFLVLLVSGSLGSRSVIVSAILFFLLIYFDLRVVISLTLLTFLFSNYIDFSTINIPFIGEASNQRIRDIGTEEVSIDSDLSRAIIYISGLNIFFDNFILGVGTGKIVETMSQNAYLGQAMMLHNTYLDFAVQFGLVGIFIIIWIIYLGLKITQANLNLGFVYFVTIILPNFSHDFFLISITPILMLLMEYYSQKIDLIRIYSKHDSY